MKSKNLTTASNIAYHNSLNPRVWKGDTLDPRVRVKLLAVAKVFLKQLDIVNFEVEDIILTGSLANYNWTNFSDFDLHIVVDFDSIDCDDIASAFFDAQRKNWNIEHNITINGHEVEMYVEDSNEPAVAQGMYSVLHNKWVKKPQFRVPQISDSAVVSKATTIARLISQVLNNAATHREVEHLIKKIYQMRQAGLDQAGEFSTENLAFKILRNQGLLNQLHRIQTKLHDRKLSLG